MPVFVRLDEEIHDREGRERGEPPRCDRISEYVDGCTGSSQDDGESGQDPATARRRPLEPRAEVKGFEGGDGEAAQGHRTNEPCGIRRTIEVRDRGGGDEAGASQAAVEESIFHPSGHG
jgi:hypothetical protein